MLYLVIVKMSVCLRIMVMKCCTSHFVHGKSIPVERRVVSSLQTSMNAGCDFLKDATSTSFTNLTHVRLNLSRVAFYCLFSSFCCCFFFFFFLFFVLFLGLFCFPFVFIFYYIFVFVLFIAHFLSDILKYIHFYLFF